MNTYEQSYSGEYREGITWAVQKLILANVLVFAIQLLIDIPLGEASRSGASPGGNVTSVLSFIPSLFLQGYVWQPVTYQFLHSGLMHLFVNMLWLYFFGPDLERTLGTRQFFRFYLLCGAVAVLANLPLSLLRHAGEQDISVVGASGAVMAVLAAFAVAGPDRQLYLFPFPLPITARGFVIIVIVLNLISGAQGGNTSVATHIGGLAAGFLYMKSIPALRRLRIERKRRTRERASGQDIGKMVDNIFKFENRNRPD